MWKKYGIIFGSCLLPFMLCGQSAPRWMDDRWREMSYGTNDYFTGFASETIPHSDSIGKASIRVENEAKREIAESIVVKIKSEQTLINESVQSNNLPEQFTSRHQSTINTSSDLEVAGLKVETYFDKARKKLYAFAYADRRELITYYTATVASDMQQIQGLVKIGAQLEQQREKAKARKQYNGAAELLAKTAKALTLLRALGASPSNDAWQALHNEVAQTAARLKLLVYVNNREELFGKPCDIVANNLKAELAQHGYRFTDDPSRADFTLNLHATTRKIGDGGDTIVFCFADVTIEWVDNYARESVYKEEFSHKGGSTTFERAGREALEEAAATIAGKMYKIIK
jgi:hypothetical protein